MIKMLKISLFSLTMFGIVVGRNVPADVKPQVPNDILNSGRTARDLEGQFPVPALKIGHFGDVWRYMQNTNEAPILDIEKTEFKNKKKRSPAPYSYGFCSLSKLCPIGSNYSRARKLHQRKNLNKKSAQ